MYIRFADVKSCLQGCERYWVFFIHLAVFLLLYLGRLGLFPHLPNVANAGWVFNAQPILIIVKNYLSVANMRNPFGMCGILGLLLLFLSGFCFSSVWRFRRWISSVLGLLALVFGVSWFAREYKC